MPAAGRAPHHVLLGVAGWPVGHSRSPAMHNAALAAMGLGDWLYVPLPLSPGRFGETVPALAAAGFRGINVTVPHKLAALTLATEAASAASAIGAANTLTFDGASIAAENTDAPGLVSALGGEDSLAGADVLVLGAGGSGRAAAWALREAGATVSIWNRTAATADALAAELGVGHAERPGAHDLIVNCTAVGLRAGDSVEALPLAGIPAPARACDLVYGSAGTPFELWAIEHGCDFVPGTEVLVAQGAASLAIWTGRDVPIDVMRDALAL